MAKISRIDVLRGNLPKSAGNARSVAAIAQNPGCQRRTVLDAAGIKTFAIAEKIGYPTIRGQSPFAISAGNAFEERLKKGSNYQLLAEAVRPFVDLPSKNLRIENAGAVGRSADAAAWLAARVTLTESILKNFAKGGRNAPHIVDHPMLAFDFAGARIFLEPDALALRVGGELELVEIKSYPVIDGQADPGKIAATAGQSAVYLLAMRATLKKLGFDPDMLRWSVILVAPRNFGRFPTAHRIPLKKKTMAIERVLKHAPSAEVILRNIDSQVTLDVDPKGKLSPETTAKALIKNLQTLPALFVPDCLAACDLAMFCRDEAVRENQPARLGRHVRDSLGEIEDLDEALRLARSSSRNLPPDLRDVGQALQTAARAIAYGKSRAPRGCGV